MKISRSHIDEMEVLSGENDHLRFDIAPAAGGKIVSIVNLSLQQEFLWRNENGTLRIHQAGADYDANFFGGIDELIPNDIPENIDGIDYPDHGELWTASLNYKLSEDAITVFGKLKRSGLYYSKKVYLEPNTAVIVSEYTIRNEADAPRHFLWKLHAALAIEAGDRLVTSAKKAKVVDPGYSRWKDLKEFSWPMIENMDASVVPDKDDSTDFFYLYDTGLPVMSLLHTRRNHLFSYSYDKNVFRFQWYFASYGGFLDHYTAILEPSTAMPLQVNEAIRTKQCTVLEPGQELNTVVRIYAGPNR